jgi:hypothetical protein
MTCLTCHIACGACCSHDLRCRFDLHQKSLNLDAARVAAAAAVFAAVGLIVIQGLRQLILNGNALGLIGGQNIFSVIDRKGFRAFK